MAAFLNIKLTPNSARNSSYFSAETLSYFPRYLSESAIVNLNDGNRGLEKISTNESGVGEELREFDYAFSILPALLSVELNDEYVLPSS